MHTTRRAYRENPGAPLARGLALASEALGTLLEQLGRAERAGERAEAARLRRAVRAADRRIARLQAALAREAGRHGR